MDKGYLVISDITGYTAFLTGSELEHAQDILQSLFGVLLKHTTPPLELSKLEGDAIFSYVPDGRFLRGQVLLEMIEKMYAVFRQAQEQMRLNTTCTCRACANIPNLDLKFFVHHGDFIQHTIAGREELSGPDVILIHRLLKNSVNEKTGLKAYTLFTEAALAAMALDGFGQQLVSHQEAYEHLGEVSAYLHDLHAMWQRDRDKHRIEVRPEEAVMVLHFDLPAPPPVAWDYLTDPAAKRRYIGADRISMSGLSGGRMGPGSQYHCAHGKELNDELIMDWRPFDYVTIQENVTAPPGLRMTQLCTIRLAAKEAGTQVTVSFNRPQAVNPALQWLVALIWRFYARRVVGERFTVNGPPILREMIKEGLRTED
ncbi:MAG: DUF2652 domain-containing protein [Chloroflexi bacterium]|nr:DUF2652 domain-containing protein [Chloroflexota bacterium]MCI0576498.1 DUF2652 domain-containing protein [Chloroflexota bacterium]MCI0650220.1 DUF2652 domain-containing protein [Chloroflexota bacterium]MCI0729398.1 DUF2652 domain-containing protein [Chloroflexota bacterium]